MHHLLEEVRLDEPGQCFLIESCDHILVLEGQVITHTRKPIAPLHFAPKLTQLIFSKSMQLCRKPTQCCSVYS